MLHRRVQMDILHAAGRGHWRNVRLIYVHRHLQRRRPEDLELPLQFLKCVGLLVIFSESLGEVVFQTEFGFLELFELALVFFFQVLHFGFKTPQLLGLGKSGGLRLRHPL